jgi:hypothetical protein
VRLITFITNPIRGDDKNANQTQYLTMGEWKWLMSLSILILCLGFVSLLHAQDRFSIGLSSQINNTRLMVDYASTQVKGAYRPTSILYTEVEFGRYLGIHTGLGYTMMTQNSDAFKNNFHYLAMPLYLKIGRLKDNKLLAFSSFVGMDMHYLLKASQLSPDRSNTDIGEYAQNFHADFATGAGVKFRVSGSFSMEALLTLSIGTMINADNAALMDINNLNTGFRLNLSYKF